MICMNMEWIKFHPACCVFFFSPPPLLFHCWARLVVWGIYLLFIFCLFFSLVLKSIGYKSVPVDGLPFDHQKGMLVWKIAIELVAELQCHFPLPVLMSSSLCTWFIILRGCTYYLGTHVSCRHQSWPKYRCLQFLVFNNRG